MLNLIRKSSSININDQEYNKMKEKILTMNNKSLPEDIFYEQRFNVNDKLFYFLKIFTYFLLDM